MKRFFVAAAVSLALPFLVATSTPSSAAVEGGYLRNQLTRMCLAASGGNTGNNVPIIQWTCTGGDEQRWILRSPGPVDYQQLINAKSGKCIGVAGGSTENGAALVQYTCNNSANQGWDVDASGRYYTILSYASNKVPTPEYPWTNLGARIVLWSPSGQSADKWQWNYA